MYDDAQDALAAEYVLGTLSADEREHAEACSRSTPALPRRCAMWERRLGELNVMVEAVEPPPEVWDKIKAELGVVEPAGEAPPAAPVLAAAEPPVETPPETSPAESPPLIMTDAPERGFDRHTAAGRRASGSGVGFDCRVARQKPCRAGGGAQRAYTGAAGDPAGDRAQGRVQN